MEELNKILQNVSRETQERQVRRPAFPAGCGCERERYGK
jgi:hypothetical protein